MNKIQLAELLDKYLDGSCTPEETEAIEQWYQRYNDQPGYTDSLPGDKKELLKAKMFNAISHRTLDAHTPSVRPVYRSLWISVAAAAVLLIFIKVIFLNNMVKPAKVVSVANLEISISNHTHNIIKQLLPDSSVVWLNPNAGLTWPKQFTANVRKVAMTGNCFFEVTKNPRRPFIISSEHIVTKVWGTSFRVIDGKDVVNAKVTVVTGKVSVSKKGSNPANIGLQIIPGEVMLYPKEQVTLKNKIQFVTIKHVDISDLSIYKHIDLSFDNDRLTEIVSVLNKKFDVDIKIQDPELNKAVMTADLNDLNLPEVLEVLKASMKLDYEVSQHLIILKKPIK